MSKSVGSLRTVLAADAMALLSRSPKRRSNCGNLRAGLLTNAGIAMAMAMAGSPTVLPNETFVATFNWGTFEGSHGLAFAGAYRVANNIQLNGGFAMSPNQGIAGGRAGIRVGF